MVLVIFCLSESSLQNPKSANLIIPSFKSIFYSFKSLCRIFYFRNDQNALTIYLKKCIAVISSSRFRSFKNSSKSPPLQSSYTIYILLCVLSISTNLIIFGLSILQSNLISFRVNSSSFGISLNF